MDKRELIKELSRINERKGFGVAGLDMYKVIRALSEELTRKDELLEEARDKILHALYDMGGISCETVDKGKSLEDARKNVYFGKYFIDVDYIITKLNEKE